MSNITVREFLRTSSISEDEDTLESVTSRFEKEKEHARRDSQWLLRRHDTIFAYEYKYRTGTFNLSCAIE